MALVVNTNTSAMRNQEALRKSAGSLNRVQERLASGLRINSAADDAAGLAIADRLSARVRQSQTEMSNLQSGINLTQTADSGLDQQHIAVARLRELTVQASNGTLSSANRDALNSEARMLLEEINQTAADTEFNGITPLESGESIDLGVQGGQELTFSQSTTDTLGLDDVDLSTAEGARSALAAIDEAAVRISNNRSSLGAQMNGLDSAISQRSVSNVNSAASESYIRDADMAQSSIDRARFEILTQSGVMGMMQANLSSQAVMRLLS